jgi:hypothetical protein
MSIRWRHGKEEPGQWELASTTAERENSFGGKGRPPTAAVLRPSPTVLRRRAAAPAAIVLLQPPPRGTEKRGVVNERKGGRARAAPRRRTVVGQRAGHGHGHGDGLSCQRASESESGGARKSTRVSRQAGGEGPYPSRSARRTARSASDGHSSKRRELVGRGLCFDRAATERRALSAARGRHAPKAGRRPR